MYIITPSKHRWLLLMAACCIMLTTHASHAAIIYVNQAAGGANNGTNWANAYTSLQSALAAAVPGDEIWVAKGVYKPSVAVDIDGDGIAGPQEVTFQIKSGVKVYGGFTGSEATLAERNWTINLTILSGDIDNNDENADANFIAENTSQLLGSNALHVVYTANVDNTTLLDGFVITAGKASTAALTEDLPNHSGGGWFNKLSAPTHTSNPTVANCIFRGNYAKRSGAAWYTTPGVKNAISEPTFTNCQFLYNTANYSGGAIFVGSFKNGVYKPSLTGCVFTGNRALRYGGAMYLLGDAATVENCTFTDNAVTVISPDGGTLPSSGGAVHMTSSEASFKYCMFTGNKATGTPNGFYEGGGGGAVYMVAVQSSTDSLGAANVRFERCGFYNNIASDNTGAWGGAAAHLVDSGKLTASYVNCVFSGNYAQTNGGAVASFSRWMNFSEEPLSFTPGLETNFTNCTFYNNSTLGSGGGLYFIRTTNEPTQLIARIENSIIFANTAATDPQIKFSGDSYLGPVIAFSQIQGGYVGTIGQNGGNNIGGDPVFVNPADPDGADNLPATSDDGLRLNAGSPAINAGNSDAAGILGIAADFAGEARIQGAGVNMGAYESASVAIPPMPVKYYWLKEWKRPRPGCLSCPWAIRLMDKAIILQLNKNKKAVIQNFEWKSEAQLAIYADSAIVRGKIAAQDNPSFQLEVYLKLIKQNDWAAWSAANRTYSALTPEAQKVALQNHQQWTYWVLSDESRLVGRAAVSGTLKLVHAPVNKSTGFQLGLGANDQDGDFGLNGEFSYSGMITYKKSKLQVSGIASLNADAQLCETDCMLNAARIDFSDSYAPDTEDADQTAYLVYPNPVKDKLTIVPAAIQDGKYSVALYNLQGQLVHQAAVQINKGGYWIDAKGIAAGIYRLELISPDGSRIYYKIVHY